MSEISGTTSFELLAPAGSPAILKAVIAAGADAVYVGGSRFGARAYAQNFSEEELCDAIDYVHLHGKKLYLTVNTLVKNSQMEELCESIRPLYERGLDAVIVQDFGVIHMLRCEYPDLPLHASTQMTITGVDGVRMLREIGISRVVLSRELSIAQMAGIYRETGMELEVFVHGALCYSYSGQCLFSSMLGGRSGNRGRCAQPCRLPYQVCGDSVCIQSRSGKRDSYILSLKDLCGIEDLPALRDAGVYSLKIEGRMKQAAYAAGVTAYYRKYIDALERGILQERCDAMTGGAMADGMPIVSRNMHLGKVEPGRPDGTDDIAEKMIIDKADRKGLLALGNRSGFTDGYYHKRNGSDMVTFEKPAYTTQSTTGRQRAAESQKPAAEKEAVAAKNGHIQVLENENKICISGWAYFHKGEASYFVVHDSPITITITGQAPQAAAKAPVTKEQIRQRLEKTGDTPFVFDALTVDADEGIFIPNGELNRMRREALAQLQEAMLAPYRRPQSAKSRMGAPKARQMLAGCDAEKDDDRKGKKNSRPRLIASVSSLEQLNEVLADGRMTDIYLETMSHPRAQLLDTLHQAIQCIKASATSAAASSGHTARTRDAAATDAVADKERMPELPRIYLALPPIFRAHTECFYSSLAEDLRLLPIEGFLVRNYEGFAWAERLFPGYERILDANVYTYNDEASAAFAECGAAGNTVPLELNRGEILARNNHNSEMVLYGYYPLMVSAQCVHANTMGAPCDRQSGITRIRDRKGIEFPVRNFCSECVNIVYNSVPTMLFSRMDELSHTGMRGFRLDFTMEDPDTVRSVLDLLPISAATGRPEEFPHTNGHYTRGVE